MSSESNRKGRPQQPKCACGKAIYKRMDAGPVATSDPYAWCRNQDCAHFNKDQSGDSRHAPASANGNKSAQPSAPKATKPAPPAKQAKESKKGSKPIPGSAKTKSVEKRSEPTEEQMLPPPPAEEESKPAPTALDGVSKVREQIKKVLGADGAYKREAIGLALALLCQELGSNSPANSLIEEFDLQKQFGINPITDATPPTKKKTKKK